MKKTLAVLLASVTLFAQGALAATLPVRVYGNDTVAGYSTMLKSSVIAPGKDVVFVVEKPDMGVVRLPAQADEEGIAQAELYGLQTRMAGEYKVAIVYPGSADASPQGAFQVFPDAVSGTQSTLQVSQALIRGDGKETARLTVTLYDAYRNPIARHAVKLISSRADDRIEALNKGVTDDQGRAVFKVTSLYPGLSVFSAVDSTVNVILTDREEVVFQELVNEIGGNLLQSNLFAADIGQGNPDVTSGPVHHFDLEDLPATARVNEQLSFTVVAKDIDNNVAKNYTGTVLFAVPGDENAVLPGNGEYTFKETNQGRFTFNLALQFSVLGPQILQVFDKDNWDIKGEVAVEVVSSQAVSPAANSSLLKIKSPTDGAELGNSFVLLSGQGDPNINLKVFDNDSKIGDSETDEEGFFSFEARGLGSGSHVFYVMSDNGDVSNSVSVTIDTLPPVINQITVSPDGPVDPGQSVRVAIQSEPNLEEAKIRVQGVDVPLTPGFDAGNYEATFMAPAAEGQYPLDVILVDKLSNKAELLNQRTIEVIAPEPPAPPKVEGLTGEAGDKFVTLKWNAVTSSAEPIDHYRIYYGTRFDQLDQILDTPGAVTEMTVGNLTNDQQTFFAVKAVDSKGVESEEASVTIGVTPVAPTLPAPPAPMTTLQAIPLNGGVTLNWFAAGATAFYYKIYFGLKAGQYDDFVLVRSDRASTTIPDLINGATYYFAMVPLDAASQELGGLSAEVSATPGATGFYGAAPELVSSLAGANLGRVPQNEPTGPETFWVIGASMLFAALVYSHKRNVVRR